MRTVARNKEVQRLKALALQQAQLTELVDDQVFLAKAAGVTWESIGGVLGITRQSAHEKYAKRYERWYVGSYLGWVKR